MRLLSSACSCLDWFRAMVPAWALTVLLLPAIAPAAAVQLPPADLTQGLSLVGQMATWIDETGNASVDDIRSGSAQANFAVAGDVVRIANDARAYWFRIDLEQTAGSGDWILAVPSVAANDLRFFGPFTKGGQALASPVTTGADFPFSTRPLAQEKFSFRMHLPEPGTYTAYLRMVSSSEQAYALTIWDAATFVARSADKRLFDGICYGVLAGLLIYTLALVLAFRDRAYLYYVLTCLFAMLTTAGFNGHAARYLYPHWPALGQISFVSAPALWIGFSTLFARHFLDLARFAPSFDKINRMVGILAMGSAALALTGLRPWAWHMVELLAVVGTVTVVTGALLARRNGFRPAKWYLFGQFALFFAVLTSVMTNWGWLDWAFMQTNGLQLGNALEALVFAMALSSRLRAMHSSQASLRERSLQLAIAAQTDPLTGIANRAGLTQFANDVLKDGSHCGLLLLDLDHFKPVNDQFGHAAGDTVLIEIASRINQTIRPRDKVARLGGDEFAVLVTEPIDRPTLEAIAKRLLEKIQQPVEYAAHTHHVGASLGIALFPENGRTLPDLLHSADMAMYHIKSIGRAGFAYASDVPNDQRAG